MKINPTNLIWKAPTENIDETPIQYELSYELGIVEGERTEPYVTVVGSLRDSEDYIAPLSDMGFSNGTHSVALRSMSKDDPTRVSEWSNSVDFVISDEIPNPPLDLAVS